MTDQRAGGAGVPRPDQVCARHPDRETGLRCVRCDRPACFECLRDASVGYQCIDCVAQGVRSGRRATTIAGAQAAERSVVVPALVAINVAIFAVTVAQSGSLLYNDTAELFRQWSLWPIGTADGELWRLFTSGFLHYGPIHLAFNMIALWVLGRDLEQVLGPVRFLVLYLVSLLGGALAVFLFQAVDSRTAGASGAVFGLMAGLAVVLVRLRRSPVPVLIMVALNLAISFLPGISLLGHLGGLVFGAAATAGMVYAPRERRAAVQAITVVVLLAVIVVGVVVRDAQFTASFTVSSDSRAIDVSRTPIA